MNIATRIVDASLLYDMRVLLNIYVAKLLASYNIKYNNYSLYLLL